MSETVEIRTGIPFADRDGTKLLGDLYLPKGVAKAPVLVAVHGGGWQNRTRATYTYWGPYLARHGIALFEMTYRLGPVGTYPRAVHDVRAAVQFIRAEAETYGIDPTRIGLMGDSAGAHLAALLTLNGAAYPADAAEPNGNVTTDVKVMVGFYGVYDLLGQWSHDLVSRPNDNIAAKFLGVPPTQDRRIYFEASPISHAVTGRTKAKFMLVAGDEDDVVDPDQTKQFQLALAQAGYFTRRVLLPGANHYWAGDAFEDEPGGFGASTAPRLLRFLQGNL